MLKKLTALIFVGLLSISLSGCMAPMIWMADHEEAKQTFELSYPQSLDIVRAAMKEKGIEFKKARIEENVAVVKGKYPDGLTVRIYVHKINATQCNISVRVGTSEIGKKDAGAILNVIVRLVNAKLTGAEPALIENP
jgi:hypothetical protein